MMRWTLFVLVLVTWGFSSEATFHKRFQSPVYPVQQPGLQYNLPPIQRYIRLNDQLYAVLGETVQYVPAAPPATVYSAPDPGAASVNTLEPISNDPPVPQTPGVGVVLTNSASDANGAATHTADAGNFLPTADPSSSQSATDELVPSAPYSAPEPTVQTVQPQVVLPNSPIPTATPVTAEPVNSYEAPSAPAPTPTDQSNVRGGPFPAQSDPHATNAGLDFHSAPSGPLVPPSQAGIAASAPLGPVVYAASGSGAPPSVDRPVVLTVSNPKVTVTTKIMKYNLRHPPKLYTEPVTVVFSNRDEKSLPTEAAKGVPFTISSVSDPSLLQQAPILVKGQDEFDQSQRLKGYSSVTSQSNFGPAAPSGNYVTHPDSSTPSVYNTPQIYQTKNTDQQSHHLISYTLAQPPLLKLQIDPATRKTFYVDASGHQIELESPGSGISPSSPYSPSSQPQGTGLQFYGAAKGLDQGATSSSITIKENVKMNDMVGLNSFYGSNNPAFLTTPRSGNGEMQDLLSTPVAYNAEGHNVRSVQSQQPRDAATLSRLPDLLRLTYQRLDKSGQADRPLMTLPGYGST